MKRRSRKRLSGLRGYLKAGIMLSALFVGVVLYLVFDMTFPHPMASAAMELGIGLIAGLMIICLFLTASLLRFSLLFRGTLTILLGLFAMLFVMLFVPIGTIFNSGMAWANTTARPDVSFVVTPAEVGETLILVADFTDAAPTQPSQVKGPDFAPALHERLVELAAQTDIRVARLREPISAAAAASQYLQQYQATLLIWGADELGLVTPHLTIGAQIPLNDVADLDIRLNNLTAFNFRQPGDKIDELSHLLLGLLYVNPTDVNDLQQALRHFNQAGNGWEARLWRGSSYYWLGSPERALQDYDRAISLNANVSALYHNRGLVNAEQENFAAAIDDYNQAIRLDDQYQRAFRHRAQAYVATGAFQAALDDYNQAILLNSNDALAYFERGNLHTILQDYTEAILDYDRAMDLVPSDSAIYIYRGNAYSALENYEAAIADYGLALRYDNSDPLPYIHRGNAYAVIGEFQPAIDDYSQAIQLAPEQGVIYAHRASAYNILGDTMAAIADYTQAISLVADDAILYVNRANAYHAIQDYDAALADYSQAIALDPTDNLVYQSRGNLKVALQDYWGAISDYSQAINLAPFDASALVARGNTYSAVFEYEAAIEDYGQAIAVDPSYALAYTNRAAVYGTLYEYGWATRQQAIVDYQTALELIADPAWREDTTLSLQNLNQ